MVSEAIILAGGFGTRLRGVVDSIPKPMASINGKPFVEFLLDYLAEQGIRHAVLSTGHLSAVIENHLGGKYKSIKLSYAVETEPLGTGGAILLASRQISSHNFLVVNGDTFFKIDVREISELHLTRNADITIALRSVPDTSRYGSVRVDTESRITAFDEKSETSGEGIINGGIYVIRKESLDRLSLPAKFSMEKQVLSNQVLNLMILGKISDGYFIDIGTPLDYEKAQRDLG